MVQQSFDRLLYTFSATIIWKLVIFNLFFTTLSSDQNSTFSNPNYWLSQKFPKHHENHLELIQLINYFESFVEKNTVKHKRSTNPNSHLQHLSIIPRFYLKRTHSQASFVYSIFQVHWFFSPPLSLFFHSFLLSLQPFTRIFSTLSQAKK